MEYYSIEMKGDFVTLIRADNEDCAIATYKDMVGTINDINDKSKDIKVRKITEESAKVIYMQKTGFTEEQFISAANRTKSNGAIILLCRSCCYE